MYWKLLKWGGALAFVAICVLAYVAEGKREAESPLAPPATPTESPKKFNF